MSDLTSKQIDAITYAYLDVCASDNLLNSDSILDKRARDEVAFACKQSKTDLENAFPFLLEEAG
jgi:hypothetical protein